MTATLAPVAPAGPTAIDDGFALVGEVAGGRIVLFGTGPIEAQAHAARKLETLTPLIEHLCACGHVVGEHLRGPQRHACHCGCPAPNPGALVCPLSWGVVVQLATTFGAAWKPGPALTAWITDEFTRRVTIENHPEGDLAVPPPAGLVPRPYQVAGARMIGLVGSALLADDMGPQPVDTPVLTPSGWERLGSLVPGDVVYDVHGRPARVDEIKHYGEAPVYRVTFSDRTSTLATADHRWQVYTPNDRTRGTNGRKLTTRELNEAGLFRPNGKGRLAKFYLPTQPVVGDLGEGGELPLDPYAYGALLGDGSLGGPHLSISCPDRNLLGWVRQAALDLDTTGVEHAPDNGRCASVVFHRNGKLRAALGELGALVGAAEKHVHPRYRLAPIEVRRAVLAGLLDTDGSVVPTGNGVEFSSASPQLAADVAWLARSLGAVATESAPQRASYRDADGLRVECLPKHRVNARFPADGPNPFRIDRKGDRWAAGAVTMQRRHPSRTIVAIEPAGTAPVCCISIDRDAESDRVYLTDNALIPTSNTGKTVTVILGMRERAARLGRDAVLPAVVVCPTAVVDSWVEHVHRWAPGWTAVPWKGSPSRRRRRAGTADVYVVSYEVARNDAKTADQDAIRKGEAPLLSLGARTVVSDECHKLKAQASAQSWAVRRLSAQARAFVGLSGTPITHALTLDSPLLTPTGWRSMGDIEVGDAVIGSDGRPTEVVRVHPQGPRQVFRVTFSDGATVDCTGDHLWAVNTRSRRSRRLPNLVLRTEELTAPRGREGFEGGLFDQGGAPRWSTPTVAAVEMPAAPVPLDPYLLGTLLANGYLASPPELVTPDVEVAEHVRAALPAGLGLIARRRDSRRGEADAYRITSGHVGGSLPGPQRGAPPNAVTAALTDLGLLGCRAWEKHIPECYLWNSEAVRLDVLRGLVDGDGTSVGSTVKYDTTSPALADGVKFLVRSLGGYVTETTTNRDPVRMPQGHTSPARPMHTLYIGMPQNPFRLKRKADTWASRWRVKGRSIVAIEARDVAPVQCITVAADDGLYVTNDFVVTHNSPGDLWPALYCMAPGAWPSRERWLKRYCLTNAQDYGASEVLGLDPRAEPEFRATLLGAFRRVAKADVLADLPPKVYSVRRVELPERYRKAYDAFENDMLAELPDSGELEAMTVLAQMGRLLQLASSACDVDTVTEEVEDPVTGAPIERKHQFVTMRSPSWKVNELLDILDERGGPRSGSQVACYAPSRQLMVLAGQAAAAKGYRVGYVIGTGPLHKPKPAMFTVSAAMSEATADVAGLDIDAPDAFDPQVDPAVAGPAITMATRKRDVAAFQNGELDLICVTTGAGGVGLTLTAASAAVFLARPWSFVESQQAEDRQHRIGSEHHRDGTPRDCIDIIDVVAVGTIETRVRDILVDRADQLSELVKDRRIVEQLLGGEEARDLRRTPRKRAANAAELPAAGSGADVRALTSGSAT